MSQPANLVPVNDPRRAVKRHEAGIAAAIQSVLDSGRYIGGPAVAAFENEFAAFLGVSTALGVGSGTDALQLALRACGVQPGDRVATVSHTAVATVAAIELVGAVPVLVDIKLEDYTIAPDGLEQAFRTAQEHPIKAVIPVHLYGHPADMPRVVKLAAEYHAVVIEDCAQAHGAAVAGRKCGAWGKMAAFSFYPTKNLGALGDAGAVVTADKPLASRARLLHEYGWRTRYISELPGMNTRLDPLQAAILSVGLKHLESDNEQRREIARRYTRALQGAPVAVPTAAPSVTHVYHQYVVRTAKRDDLKDHLAKQGIETAVLYPHPVHLQPAYKGRLQQVGSLQNAEQVCKEILCLPIFPELSEAEVERVESALRAWRPVG